MRRIAIQGQQGSYHAMAAAEYFAGEQVEVVCCDTFEEVFSRMAADPSLLALVAIENTIAGSLLHNYELLRASGATVIGEHKVHIQHAICCLPDDDWDSLTAINSHPVAFMQCRAFLAKHPRMMVVECDDTAGAAAEISRRGLRGKAAICHHTAAALYGMKVLEDHIEDNKHNFTRFLLLSHNRQETAAQPLAEANKASIVFSLPHTEGSLSKVLTILSFYDINLTKIQSLPIIGCEWEYMFYVDVTFNSLLRYRQSIEAITPLTSELNILGEYVAC